MVYNNSKDALNWLINHPLEKLYVDEYGNYVIWGPYSNIIEYWHFLGDWEDEDGNLYPGDWDFERLSIDEFLKEYENEKLSNDINFNDF